ncbi:hypothetical protein [Tateyamaria sp. SN3-11]|uniref:hypothetical protein n=1 Tax=Tateyamaria sp. SN3-11 TaxID=3092147 RepID=UPI0039E96F34
MGFLLAGVALLLSTMNILEQGQRYVREIASGPQLVFEHRAAPMAQDADKAMILRANPDHPVILSGFPAYQSVAFTMPVDARPTSGYLQINATSQVLGGVEGVLRISIDNTRRGEMLLRSGEVGRSLQIPLSPSDFAGNQLVVSFSLQGTGPQQQCGPEDGVQAVVEIETTSAVFVTLDRPLQSARDRVHAWGDAVRIAWPAWLKQDEQLRRLVLATEFRRRGLAPVFVASPQEAGLTTLELRAALPAFPLVEAEPQTLGPLAQTGANAGLRRFYRQAIWRERFALGGAGGQNIPSQLDLRMLFGRLVGDHSWVLTVTLNNRLIFQEHVTGVQAAYQALIDLPSDIQTSANTLEVIATTSVPRGGACDQGPELVAEMLPTSRLITGDTPFANAMSDLHAALRDVGVVNVAMNAALTAIDADTASHMLDQVIPAGVAFKPAGATVQITVLSTGHPAPTLSAAGPTWLVTQYSTPQPLSITTVQPGVVLPRTGVALLITPGTPTSAEAEG